MTSDKLLCFEYMYMLWGFMACMDGIDVPNKRGHKVAKVSLHNCQDDDAQKTAFCQRIEGSSMFCRRTGGIGWLGRKWWIGWRRCQE